MKARSWTYSSQLNMTGGTFTARFSRRDGLSVQRADRKPETRQLPAAAQHAVQWPCDINVVGSTPTRRLLSGEEGRGRGAASIWASLILPLQLIQDIPQLPLHRSSSSQPERKHTGPVVGAPAGLRGRSPVGLQPNPIRDGLQTKHADTPLLLLFRGLGLR